MGLIRSLWSDETSWTPSKGLVNEPEAPAGGEIPLWPDLVPLSWNWAGLLDWTPRGCSRKMGLFRSLWSDETSWTPSKGLVNEPETPPEGET
ncbi:MAG: hypothetical protein EOP33_10030 [Rickettsiaceae bacterium]|nr:MAG: hypothetical protein EOP33_10030 [Rickettsiaceae bacterium]